ncbi:GNAT family N-acetyltransferase [Sulfoacidibacillus ferrooxidans]|uniref:BioF2-like acetyltransferase domain-containing protein n=1 Tax=Sulfoacidibacillus ferrooxidans TaxID=2005001 RepID=A0A9X2ADB4_9BACL|nr:GNAT family N-acetyltransferase [Sulfoacidibacillus ferrooxidans]MCI0184719.1 hypothetical protein [Sulfoacidibacillus ferrooxidans]
MRIQFDYVGDISERQWRYFVARCEPFATPEQNLDWMAFLERRSDLIDRKHCPPIKVMSVWNAKDLEALFYVSVEDNLHVTSADARTYVNLSRELCANIIGFHVRLSLAHGLGLIYAIGDNGNRAVMEGIEALEYHAWERGLNYVQISRVHADSDLRSFLAKRGYLEFPNISNYVLDVTWGSFDEYLGSVSGKTRRNIRRDRRIFESSALYLGLLNSEVNFDRLYHLHEAVCEKYGGKPYVRRDFFRTALSDLSGFGGVCAFYQKEPVGAILCYRSNEVLSVKFAGMNYQWREANVYPNLMYGVIEQAIESGIRKIALGLANEEQKKRLGAREELSYRYILPFSTDLKVMLSSTLALWKGAPMS